MPNWMYNCIDNNDDNSKKSMPNNDDNEVASKIEIAMNLALDEQSVDALHEFDNFDEDIEFSDN